MGTRFFISYARQDFAFANALHDDLTAAGHDVWIDLGEIPRGVDWWQAIAQGIAAADVCVLVASPWSMNSSVVAREWQTARQHGKPLIVLALESLYRDCFVPDDAPWLDCRRAQTGTAARWATGTGTSSAATNSRCGATSAAHHIAAPPQNRLSYR